MLPNLVSQSAPEGATGTALGTFHTLQYLGSATGAPVAGALAHLPSDYIMVTLMTTSLIGCLLMVSAHRGAALQPGRLGSGPHLYQARGAPTVGTSTVPFF